MIPVVECNPIFSFHAHSNDSASGSIDLVSFLVQLLLYNFKIKLVSIDAHG